ncbi:ASCH domain-containing protein [Streptomyces sp. NBC_01298]|uniref:ASCH domain-containing protein n=1 Tax=Streptomyces sp. NBC_01298 TaxID=2903817 RepID=UPI002E15268F|nr:ASCH domain-containing protein [Streptomyces sp. NBC_01298]
MTAYEDLPPIEFAFPGPLRDALVAAVLSGAKTTTTAVLADYEAAGDPLPVAGERMVIVDSAGRPVGVLEVTDVRVLRLADVDLRHALDEGEGFASVAEWRSGHEDFWHGPQMREALGDPHFTVDDDTPVVAERFRLVTRLP